MPGGRGRLHCGQQLWENPTLSRFLFTTWNFESWNSQMSIFDSHRPTKTIHRSFRQSVSQPNYFPHQLLSSPSHFSVLLPESNPDCCKKTTIKWDSVDPEFNEQVCRNRLLWIVGSSYLFPVCLHEQHCGSTKTISLGDSLESL